MSDVKTKEFDKILARELNELSFNDRITIQEDLHCVKSTYIEETPELIESSLLRLSDEIQAIPPKDRTAYDDALITDSTYVQSKDFCLMFLRASLFDVKKAAWRFTRYTQLAFNLFGPEALHRPLRFSDLDKNEQDGMKMGYYQILPTRDRAGRLVTFFRDINREGFTNRNRVRMFLYMYTAMAEDVETQRTGHVSISLYSAEDLATMSRETDNDLFASLVHGSPVRFISSHFCLTSNSVALVLARTFVYFAIANKEDRPRVKWYNGFDLETQYVLMSFGIPVADLPITNSMTIKTKNHHRWIKNRKMLEAVRARGEDTSHWVEYPGIHDVLFRQGGNYTKQVNLEFVDLIEPKMDIYLYGNTKMKELVLDELIQAVQSKGGKFLEYNRQVGLWLHIQDVRVLGQKIYTAIYYHKMRKNARQPLQRSNSQTDLFIKANKRRKFEEDTCCK